MEESKDMKTTASCSHSSYSTVSSSSSSAPSSPASPPYTHFEHLKHFVRSQWKIFAYERADDLRVLREEIEYCTSAFVLACLYVFGCAFTLCLVEGPDEEPGQQEDAGSVVEVVEGEENGDGEQLLERKKEFLRNLLALTQSAIESSENDWMSQALEKMKGYEEEVKKEMLCHADVESPSGPTYDWGILNSFVYVLTVTTSIGYGHIAPSTNAGRALTIIYAIVGIPLFLILLADFGKLFTRILKSIFVFLRRVYRSATCRRVRKKKPVQSCLRRIRACFSWICCRDREADAGDTANGPAPTPQDDEQFAVDDTFNLPVSLALIILLIYILFGCIFYTMWEDWTYFEAFYFIFISMTTIGFGDYVPKHPAFMMATTLYLLFGLALTAMSINIIQEKLSDTFRTATKKLKESFAYIMAATQGEEGVEGEEDQDGEKPKEVEVAEVHGKEDKKES